jgi:hypothetical protein
MAFSNHQPEPAMTSSVATALILLLNALGAHPL